ncbi:MAG: S46 family peptidase [bacterium]
MPNTRKRASIAAVALALAVSLIQVAFQPCGFCEEGMWLPYAIPGEILSEMQAAGLELGPEDIWNDAGSGLANAVVHVGATGSFVSGEGLILTNHHVAYGAVQRISTPERNYIESGYLARTREDEVPAHGYIAYLLLSSEDVTPRVKSELDESMTPVERQAAIEDATKLIVQEAEEGGGVYCEVNAFFGGGKYVLDTYLKIPDVRVVYVPARPIGEYGGDVDNWMWPRHTGDFSFLRAYVGPDGQPAEFSDENVPYRPKRFLKVAAEGLSREDFAMIIGFPGRTNRYLSSYAMAYYRDFTYPEHIRLYRKMLEVLDAESIADPEAAVRVAGRVKGINNRFKNNLGMLDGFERFHLVEAAQARERDFLSGPAAKEIKERYAQILSGFEATYDQELEHAMQDLLLDTMLSRASLAGQAMRLYKWSLEKQKPDLERDPDFMDREIPDHRMRLRVFQMGYHQGSDRAIMKLLLEEFAALPEGRGDEVLKAVMGGVPVSDPAGAIDRFLDGLYQGTSLGRAEERLRMFDLSHDELMSENDPFIDLAGRLYEENRQRLDREKRLEGSLQALVPEWIRVIDEGTERPLYPDANGTMRVNYGEVRGYSNEEGKMYEPFTTLGEIPAKDTGEPPFDAPRRLLDLAAAGEANPFVDPQIGDVPVDFLTTHDSTGGNSGSPVVNARGELVGCLFDGTYESMTGDFDFQDDITRSISVDIRYVLFIARYMDHAENVLKELGIE